MNCFDFSPEEISEQVEAYKALISNRWLSVQIQMQGPTGETFWALMDQESLVRYPLGSRIRIKPQ